MKQLLNDRAVNQVMNPLIYERSTGLILECTFHLMHWHFSFMLAAANALYSLGSLPIAELHYAERRTNMPVASLPELSMGNWLARSNNCGLRDCGEHSGRVNRLAFFFFVVLALIASNVVVAANPTVFTLIVQREKAWTAGAVNQNVYLNDKYLGGVSNGSTVTFSVPAASEDGKYVVRVKWSTDPGADGTSREFTARPGDRVTLRTSTEWGWLTTDIPFRSLVVDPLSVQGPGEQSHSVGEATLRVNRGEENIWRKIDFCVADKVILTTKAHDIKSATVTLGHAASNTTITAKFYNVFGYVYGTVDYSIPNRAGRVYELMMPTQPGMSTTFKEVRVPSSGARSLLQVRVLTDFLVPLHVYLNDDYIGTIEKNEPTTFSVAPMKGPNAVYMYTVVSLLGAKELKMESDRVSIDLTPNALNVLQRKSI